MVVIRLMGGLGNQLFQYFFYISLLDYGIEAKLDKSYYSKLDLNKYYQLELLVNINSNEFLNLVNFPSNGFNLKANRIKKEINIFFERKFSYHWNQRKIFTQLNESKDLVLTGYFQDPRYFAKLRNLDKRIGFEFRCDDYSNVGILESIKLGHSIGVHVRRGDYLHPKTALSSQGRDYYIRAIKLVLELRRLKTANIFIFSNDIEWCKENLSDTTGKINYVNYNDEYSGYKDLYLMMNCNDTIISASSFSWWAAFLNPKADKIIVCPRFWYKSKYRYHENFGLRVDGWYYV